MFTTFINSLATKTAKVIAGALAPEMKLVEKTAASNPVIELKADATAVDEAVAQAKEELIEYLRNEFVGVENKFRTSYSSYNSVSSALLEVRDNIHAVLDKAAE